MKYTSRFKRKDGKEVWRFNPPSDVRKAGVLKSCTFIDGRTARFQIPKLVEVVEKFRRGEIREGGVSLTSRFVHLAGNYMETNQFKELKPSSQRSYEVALRNAYSVSVGSKTFGEVQVKDLDTYLCRQVYSSVLEEKGTSSANTLARVVSIVLNHGVSIGLLPNNPMAYVKKKQHEPDTANWTKEQVESFLETAYSKFEWRNIGLVVHMCYEWAQRPVDIRSLTWDNFDFDNRRVHIKQKKRGAEVTLPVEEPLLSLLLQQKEDWDFQEYVVPHHVPCGDRYKMMTQNNMNSVFCRVREEAGLPEELTVGRLRSTAINEFLEAGVDTAAVMSVTGHKNITSLNPYVKHRYETAKSAVSKRRGETK